MIRIGEVTDRAPIEALSELEEKFYKTLGELGIGFTRVDNEAVEAMEDCVEIGEKLGAEIRKSIFVCDRKKVTFYLVIMPAGKFFITKSFCEKLSCSRVSFAPAECMQELLGVQPGSASAASLLSDVAGRVCVVVDKEVADAEWFACNPGANRAHVRFKTKDLLEKFLPYTKHTALVVDL